MSRSTPTHLLPVPPATFLALGLALLATSDLAAQQKATASAGATSAGSAMTATTPPKTTTTTAAPTPGDAPTTLSPFATNPQTNTPATGATTTPGANNTTLNPIVSDPPTPAATPSPTTTPTPSATPGETTIVMPATRRAPGVGTTTLNPAGKNATAGSTRGQTTLNPITRNPPTPADATANAARRTTLNDALDTFGSGVSTTTSSTANAIVSTLSGTALVGSGFFTRTSTSAELVAPLEQSGDWVRVQTAVGTEGWMPVNLVPALARSTSTQLDVGGRMVLGRSVPLRSGADFTATATERASAGDTIVVLERAGDWLLVRAPNGGSGWVQADALVGLGRTIEQRIAAGSTQNVLAEGTRLTSNR